jgi:copper resistance protein C
MRLLALAVCLLALQQPQLALAHAKPQVQSPANNAELTEVKEIRLQFSERLEPAFCTLTMFNAEGQKVVLDKPQINDKTLVMPLPNNLAKGRYTVKWSVVSVDGHRTKNSYQFVLK